MVENVNSSSTVIVHPTVLTLKTELLEGALSLLTIPVEPQKSLSQEVHRLALKYNQDENLINRIIKCESSLYKNAVNENKNAQGEVWSTDYGPMQINDYYHAGKMRAMGLSIYKWENSLEYGVGVLLAREGTRHWSASASCWGN